VLAVGLAAVGGTLALQQVQSLTVRLMAEAEFRARRIAEDARAAFDRQINMSLRLVDEHTKAQPQRTWNPPEWWPGWIDGLYVSNGKTLTVLAPASDHPDEKENQVEAILAARWVDYSADRWPPLTRPYYERIGEPPDVLACLTSQDASGQPVVIAGRIDHLRLKHDLLEPLLPSGDGLELVPVNKAAKPWAQHLGLPTRFWAIQPTRTFVAEQRQAVLLPALMYVGLTLLALVTLVAAMWFLIRLARREMALAAIKADFVANVSHELKTPLALIRMFGETLQSGRVTSEEKRQEYYAIIARESTRLTSLIDNILDFARIEAGRKEYTFEPTNVAQVVRDTYEAYRFQLDHKWFEHHLAIDEDLPPILADRDAISRVLLNLMSNSVKYSDEERYLAIEVTRDTRRGRRGVLISVHDRGIGISPEDRSRLFNGFFRAADGRVRRRSGSGLGLELAKHIVDAHSGSMDVESRLVKGTTFRIFLPAAETK